MAKKDIIDKLFEQRKELLDVFKTSLIKYSKSYYASKNVTDKNFRKSDLLKNITLKRGNEKLIVEAPSYIQNLDEGRQKFSRKVPIKEIIKWIKKNNIQPNNGKINSMAFAIQMSIFKDGLKPRNFIDKSLKDLYKEVDKITDELLERELNNL